MGKHVNMVKHGILTHEKLGFDNKEWTWSGISWDYRKGQHDANHWNWGCASFSEKLICG
jgi:hypothetical protein